MPELPHADSEHPARRAAWRSMDAAARGDRQAWLDNFDDEAIVEDPVGPSYLDPEGRGHRGKAALAEFWDKNIAPGRPMFSLSESFACGDECANIGTLSIQFPNGVVTQLRGIFTYRVNDEGKLIALRTYWQPTRMQMYPPYDERMKS